MTISTHVLDAVAGAPAAGLPVVLEQLTDTGWAERAARVTDGDGRVSDLAAAPVAGTYRLRFDVAALFGDSGFYPEVTIAFRIRDPTRHHHVPLLLSPYAYSTYRGS